jgi:drug/metabolite transporter (DMT)-like permease
VAASLALAASVFYGLSNFVGPRLSRDAPTYVILLAGQAVAFALTLAVVVVTATPIPDGTVVAAALITGVANAVGLIAFYRAAELGPLSIVAPIGATAAVVPVVVGIAEGEGAGPLKLLGIVFAIGGVALAARSSEPDPPPTTPAGAAPGDSPHAFAVARPEDNPHPVAMAPGAVAWSIVAAAGFGCFLTFIRPASEDGIFFAVAGSRVTLLLTVVGAALILGRQLRAPARELPKLAIPGLLLCLGTLTYAAATQEGDLSVVSVLGALFPVVTVGLAFIFAGERLSRIQAIGVVAALLGVILLSAR